MDKRACLVAVVAAFGVAGTAQAAKQQVPTQLPGIPVPVPSVPSLPVPVPQVPVPVPEAPALPVPVPLPQAPPAAPPRAPAPAAVAPSQAAPSAGAGGGSRVSARRPAAGGSGSAGGGTTVGEVVRRAAAGSGAGRSGQAGASEETPEAGSRSRVAARDRRLQRTVRRLRQCLPALPRVLTRVLVLRTGIGEAEPHSRRQVARRLDRPVRAVRRYELRGVRRLREAARNGECNAGAAHQAPDGAGAPDFGSSPAVAVGAGTTAGTDRHGGTDAAAGAPSQGGDGDGAGGGGRSGSGGSGDDDRSGVRGESEEEDPGPIAGLVPRPPSPTDLTVPFLVLLALAAGFVGIRAFQRFHAGDRE